MSNVMSLKSFKNNVKRNGFDLSFKNAFTAKAGELLPIFCKEVIPGDKWKINGQAFTRTQPIMSPAFVRLREYYDFFFVPYKLLWNRYPTFFTNLPDYHQAADINSSVNVGDQHPYFTFNDAAMVELALAGKTNMFGYNRQELFVKLMSYLDYCSSYVGAIESQDIVLNPNPLLAYQKVCQDFFRDDQWESAAPWRYNIDYIVNTGNIHIPVSSIDYDNLTMFDLNYCNYPKDYFMGMLPSPQFGDDVFVPLGGDDGLMLTNPNVLTDSSVSGSSVNNLVALGSDFDGSVVAPIKLSDGSITRNVRGIGFDGASNGVSILALRQAEAMQKWREIAQSGRQDYQTQMQKHFGVTPSDAMSNHCKYLGGWTSNIDISEVVNTNLSQADQSQADIFGKGVGSSRGNIDFDAKEHGLIIGIYHCLPLLDYSTSGIPRLNMKTHFTDYAIPEFDSVGMEQVRGEELFFYLDKSQPNDSFVPELGWVPRYADYKTSVDRIHGAFTGFNHSLDYWVASFTDDYLKSYFEAIKSKLGKYTIDYSFFKVNPNILDNLFGVNADADVDTDQFLVNSFFDTKVVRNLDYNGLPY